jgi:hypothetical protein
MKRLAVPLLAILLALSAAAQSDPWAPIRIFEGKWQGEITGKPGKQLSSRQYHFELDGKFLSQRDDSVFQNDDAAAKPKTRVDFGYFSYDKFLNKIVWRQFHSEGFVNEYRLETVSADNKSLEFVTVRIENLPEGWRAKKSYRVISNDDIEETFSLAPPGKDFEVYTQAHLKRVR